MFVMGFWEGLNDNDILIQVPYAVGFLVVNLGADVGAMPLDQSNRFNSFFFSAVDEHFDCLSLLITLER